MKQLAIYQRVKKDMLDDKPDKPSSAFLIACGIISLVILLVYVIVLIVAYTRNLYPFNNLKLDMNPNMHAVDEPVNLTDDQRVKFESKVREALNKLRNEDERKL